MIILIKGANIFSLSGLMLLRNTIKSQFPVTFERQLCSPDFVHLSKSRDRYRIPFIFVSISFSGKGNVLVVGSSQLCLNCLTFQVCTSSLSICFLFLMAVTILASFDIFQIGMGVIGMEIYSVFSLIMDSEGFPCVCHNWIKCFKTIKCKSISF